MDKNYFRGERSLTQDWVTYFVTDIDNNILHKAQGAACFSYFFHNAMNKSAANVYLAHPTQKMAYDESEIQRYAADLSGMGFKFTWLGEWGESTIFQIKLEDMETKDQFCSTLTLIRTLFESNSARVPEQYFRMLDENPEVDKFQALQNAHRKICPYSGHSVIGDYSSKNITLEILFQRFKERNMTPFTTGYVSLNTCWAGDQTKYKKLGELYQ